MRLTEDRSSWLDHLSLRNEGAGESDAVDGTPDHRAHLLFREQGHAQALNLL